MTEILEKTGLVERSGQGVDKIFSITLSEGKAEPDYSDSDNFQVSLILKAEITDRAFHVFVNQYQNSGKVPKLGVEQIITLCKIRSGISKNLKTSVVEQLEKSGLIRRSGHSDRYTLSEDYHALVSDGLRISNRYVVKEVEQLLFSLQGNALKIGDLEEQLSDLLNRNQIKYLLSKLLEDKVLKMEGKIKGTRYSITDNYAQLRGSILVSEVVADLRRMYES